MPLKMYLQVTAGVEPGIGIGEYTKRWEWSPARIEGTHITMSPEELLEFHELSEKAHQYATQLQNPGFVNWVTTEWIWLPPEECKF